MKIIENKSFEGERSLFNSRDLFIRKCMFHDGESPLKESRNLKIHDSTFQWKYPLWYCQNVICHNLTWLETARSGVWYTKHIEIYDSKIDAPKQFRRCEDIKLVNVNIKNASETLWKCKGIKAVNIKAKGDYFGFNSEDIEIDGFDLEGNYCFDGAKNIVIRNSKLKSKDSFWNTENVVVMNSEIDGEYIGWNSKNLTFINCKISSLQGFCYIENLKLVNCDLLDSSLIFEYCKDIDAEVKSVVESIKNPYSGKITVKGVKNLILDDSLIDKSKLEIKIRG